MDNMAKNLKKLTVFILVAVLLLVCRLAYIQIVGGKELTEATNAQSLISLEGSNTRGIIYDRNGAALVADSKRYIYIIKKSDFDFQTAKLLKSIDAGEVSSDNEEYYVYYSSHYDKSAAKRLSDKYNAYILQASARYSDEQLAEHLIGYVNKQDSSGAAGLELMFDEQLNPLNRHVYAAADVNGNLLPGRGLIITSDKQKDSSVKEGIRTTVDKELQKAVEGIIEEAGMNCAVAVLDSNSGGISAMACAPGFNPNEIDSYLESGDNELVNKVTQGQYAPGSVFKIIMAAAALEEGIGSDKVFACKGYTDTEGLKIKCETGGDEGHGKITMDQAFAYSCNSYFIKLGKELGSDKIIEYAKRFHLGEKAFEGYPQESTGYLMNESQRLGAAVANLSIGQGETLVTPLQIARITNVIAGRGIDKGVHILMEEEATDEQIISKNTAEKICEMMESVSDYGTAGFLEMKEADGSVQAAVKTGTSEYVSNGVTETNAWITGYTPCDNPEYTITVLVEGGASGAAAAGPVFKQIIEYLKKSGSYSRPTLA